jgi:Dynamin central region
MQVARNKEAAFFGGHPAYAGAANTGTDFLSRRLEAQLVRAIQARLPTIRTAVDNGCAFSAGRQTSGASVSPRA